MIILKVCVLLGLGCFFINLKFFIGVRYIEIIIVCRDERENVLL